MKKLITNVKEAVYSAPSIEALEVVAERGFEASMPGVVISPWETEDGELEF